MSQKPIDAPDLPSLDFLSESPDLALRISQYYDDLYLCWRSPEAFEEEFGADKFAEMSKAAAALGSYSRTRLYGTICAAEGPAHVTNAIFGKWLPSPILTVQRIVHLRILYGHYAFNYYGDPAVYETFQSLTATLKMLGVNMSPAALYKLVDHYALRGWYWTDHDPSDNRGRLVAPTSMALREWDISSICNALSLARIQQWNDVVKDMEEFTSRMHDHLENWHGLFETEFGMPFADLKHFDMGLMPPSGKFDRH